MTVSGSETRAAPARERIKVRFGATLAANLLRTALSFLGSLLVARGLGASGYGDLNFLLGSFAAVNLILDMGTSPAFYTFISRQRRGRNFYLLYLAWTLGVQLGGTLLIIGLWLPDAWLQSIWLGHARLTIVLAFGVSFLNTQIWALISQMGEALRQTVVVQIGAAFQALLHLALVALAVTGGWLSVAAVLVFLASEYVILAAVLGPGMMRASVAPAAEADDNWRSHVREFVDYCRPLVLYNLVGFGYHFADRWLLQDFGGAQQQGYFSIGQQFSAISLLATTSILNVFWKEIAEARSRQDHARVAVLYGGVRRALYFATSGLSCLLVPYVPEIITALLGSDYQAAWLPFAILLLYPIHQSLGQLQGTFFYAIGDTSTYSRFGIGIMLVSVPLAYLLLAPPTTALPGLGLGAAGLALRLVIMQVGGVSLQAAWLARKNGWRTDFGYQVGTVAVLMAISGISKLSVAWLPPAVDLWSLAARLGAGGVIYLTGSAGVLYLWPAAVGLDREHLLDLLQRFRRWRLSA